MRKREGSKNCIQNVTNTPKLLMSIVDVVSSISSHLNLDYFAKRFVSSNLEQILNGDDEAIITPLGREHGCNFLVREWESHLNANKDKLLTSDLEELEMRSLNKIGPRSFQIDWENRKEGTLAYFKDNKYPSTPDFAPPSDIQPHTLSPLSVENAAKYIKTDTNSCMPYCQKKGIVLDKTVSNFHKLLSLNLPAILLTRTQELWKTRDVWGIALVQVLNEMRFYRPLLEVQKQQWWRAALRGPEAVNVAVTLLIDTAKKLGYILVSLDFINYDRSLTSQFQIAIGNDYYKKLFKRKHSDEIDFMIRQKYSCGLITPDGIIEGDHGEPSGSALTNEDDSVCQFGISKESKLAIDEVTQVQGDDGAYCIPPESIDEFIASFERYGFMISKEKCYFSFESIIYLQNLYHDKYRQDDGVIRGIYPTCRALGRILYQERWSRFQEYELSGADYYSIRTICILENCKHHPLFEDFVKFILRYDKYGLSPSSKGLKNYVKMISKSSGLDGILHNQYGDDVKGIRSFETVKLIKKLSVKGVA